MPRIFISLFWVLLLFSCKPSAEREAKEVHIRLAGEPDGLNPILLRNGYARQLVKQIFQPLMEFDPESLDLVPVLAIGPPEKQLLQEGSFQGGVAYTFEIRKEAQWENGSPVLAADYIFTIKNIFNPHLSNIYRFYLDFLKKISIDPQNPRKFTVYTDRQYFLAEMVCSNIEIMPEYAYDPEGIMRSFDLEDLLDEEKSEALQKEEKLELFARKFKETHIAHSPALITGSGAYRLTEWKEGQRLRLEKKENWWGDAIDQKMLTARVSAIRYSVIPDINSAISLLKNGNLDVLSGIPARQFVELQKDDYLSQSYIWSSPPQLSYMYIALNRKNPKLADKRVRRTLAHLLPTKNIIDQVLYGLGKETIGPFSPECDYYNHQLQPISAELDSAVNQLQEAGWEDTNGNGIVDKMIDGSLVEMTLLLEMTAGNEQSRQIGLIFRENARKAGIDIQLEAVEFSKLSDHLRSRNFEMSYSRRVYSPGETDPGQTWYTGKNFGGKTNYSGFGNAESDALIDALRQSLNKKDRAKKYRKLQALIYKDQPVLFVAVPQSCIAIHHRFLAKTSSLWPGYFPEHFQWSATK